MGAAQPAAGLQQPPEHSGGDRERRIRDHMVRLQRQAEVTGVGPHDDDAVAEPTSEVAGAGGMRLDSDDPHATRDERSRERAVTGADVDHERVGREGGVSDELGGPTRFELVPSPPGRRGAHGDGP